MSTADSIGLLAGWLAGTWEPETPGEVRAEVQSLIASIGGERKWDATWMSYAEAAEEAAADKAVATLETGGWSSGYIPDLSELAEYAREWRLSYTHELHRLWVKPSKPWPDGWESAGNLWDALGGEGTVAEDELQTIVDDLDIIGDTEKVGIGAVIVAVFLGVGYALWRRK